MSSSHLNEPNYEECNCCGGDGGWYEPGYMYEALGRYVKCEGCGGDGLRCVEAEEVDEFWMEEEA